MVERTIKKEILESINKFVDEAKKYYNVKVVILFGSYAKGTENENSDIDIAIISEDFEDVSNPFVEEVINTGILVA